MSKRTGVVSLITPIGIGLLSGPMATDVGELGLFQFIVMEKEEAYRLACEARNQGIKQAKR